MLRIITVFFLAILLLACSEPKPTSIKLQGPTMGTQYHITIVDNDQQPFINKTVLKGQIDRLLTRVNQQMSTYLVDSEISRFNRYPKTDWFPISKDFAQVVEQAQKISKATHGAFDISVAPLVDLWGFGANNKLTIPDEESINQVKAFVGYQQLAVRRTPAALRKQNPALHIDLSAIAKGFAVDKVSALLQQKGFNHHLVEIGGEITARGHNSKGKNWQVAIESPGSHTPARQLIELNKLSVATSGDYHNYFIHQGVRYSHTINPKTGYPVKHSLASTTVLHRSTMVADAYATALMVMGEEPAKALAEQQSLRINLIIRSGQNYRRWNNLSKLGNSPK